MFLKLLACKGKYTVVTWFVGLVQDSAESTRFRVIVWVGTGDQVVRKVLSGIVDNWFGTSVTLDFHKGLEGSRPEKASFLGPVFLGVDSQRVRHLREVLNMIAKEKAELKKLPDLVDISWW